MTEFSNKIDATVYNFAFGDAWGFVTEFKKFKNIVKNQYQPPTVLKVSDDTQMGLYTMQALKLMIKHDVDFSKIDEPKTINRIRNSFAKAYVMFYYDNDNDRAPGMTCMGALEAYIHSPQLRGDEGAKNNSLGCGTIMRTPWIGLLPLGRREMAGLAVIQSQTTHGHPVSWIVSAVLTLMIDDLLHKKNVDENDVSMFDHAIRAIDEIIDMDLALLSEFVVEMRAVKASLTNFANSWDSIEEVLSEADQRDLVDVNRVFGEGWTADESLYNALGVCSLYDDPSLIYAGVRRLVYTEGDSDSIAAIGGALFGAKYGEFAVSKNSIISSLEPRYRDELNNMVEFIHSQW